MKELIIKVEGMVCGGCENRIQNAIKNLDNVEDVKADYKTGNVKITMKEEADIKSIKQKIEDIGFSVKD